MFTGSRRSSRLIRVGSTWYGFGEDGSGEDSSDASFQDVPCYVIPWATNGPGANQTWNLS